MTPAEFAALVAEKTQVPLLESDVSQTPLTTAEIIAGGAGVRVLRHQRREWEGGEVTAIYGMKLYDGEGPCFLYCLDRGDDRLMVGFTHPVGIPFAPFPG